MAPTAQETATGWHQPVYFDEFRCIGADCEDTCCQGMSVSIDAGTYAKYQGCTDAELSPKLQQFVTIRPAPTARNFAAIQLQDAQCPFLNEKLCSIQQKLGADYLSRVCETYPRVVHTAGSVTERSLDLSCPEAARLVLQRREGIRFQAEGPEEPQHWGIRKLILSILQNRHYSVSRRVLLAGHVCSKLAEVYRLGRLDTIAEVLEGFELAIEARLFDAHLNTYSASPVPQLAVVLELIIGRVRLDYVSPRFLELYNDFTAGLQLTPESTLETLGEKYREGYETWFMPFMNEQEHIMENYLVAYAYKNLLPFGSNPASASGEADAAKTIEQQYMLMATYFSLAKALMVGTAARRGAAFHSGDAIRVLQVFTRTMEHCTTFPALVLETLASKGIGNMAGMAILSQNIATPKHRAARG